MAFKFIDISDLTEGQLIEVIEENAKTATFTREEIRKLKAAAKPKTATPSIIIDNSKTEEQPAVDRSDFEDEVEYYYSQVKEITPATMGEKLHLCVPKRTNKNFEKIILRLKLESLRNIREINEVIREYLSVEDPEEMQMFKDEILFEQQKIAFYDQLLSPVKEEVEQVEEEEQSNRMIFVPTNGGNIRILDEIDHIPDTFYDLFLELFLSIKDGSFKNVKRFTNNAALTGLVEVKNPQSRVVFARLNENTYAIITAFVKKTQRDKGYLDSLKNKAADYKAISEILKRNLSNPEFLELHQQYEDELFRKLGYDPVTKTFVKGGK